MFLLKNVSLRTASQLAGPTQRPCPSRPSPCHLPSRWQFSLARGLPVASVRLHALHSAEFKWQIHLSHEAASPFISMTCSSGGIPKFLLPLDDRRVSLIVELSRKVPRDFFCILLLFSLPVSRCFLVASVASTWALPTTLPSIISPVLTTCPFCTDSKV